MQLEDASENLILTPLTLTIGDPVLTAFGTLIDTVGTTYAAVPNYCGPRTFTNLVDFPWLTVDEVTGEMNIVTAWPEDESLASTSLLTVQVEITLVNYPTISAVLEFPVEFFAPPLSEQTEKNFSDELTARMPVPTEAIAPTYTVNFGVTVLFSFYFADPGLFADVTDIAALKIKLMD